MLDEFLFVRLQTSGENALTKCARFSVTFLPLNNLRCHIQSAVPSQPQNFHGVSDSPNSIKLQWEPPYWKGGPVRQDNEPLIINYQLAYAYNCSSPCKVR